MAYMVMAYIVMAYMVMAYIVMAYIVMAFPPSRGSSGASRPRRASGGSGPWVMAAYLD